MTTRRQVLAAAIAAPIVATPAAACAAPKFACMPMGVSAQWQDAVAQMDAASSAHDAYYEATYEPAWNAAKEQARQADEQLQRRLDEIPHYTTSLAYRTADGDLVQMTTANKMQVAQAIGSADLAIADDYVLCCRELVLLIGKRILQENDIKAKFGQPKVYPAQLISPEIIAEEKRLELISSSAFQSVADFRAITPADLIAKVEFHKAHDCELLHDQMLADLRRVFGERSA